VIEVGKRVKVISYSDPDDAIDLIGLEGVVTAPAHCYDWAVQLGGLEEGWGVDYFHTHELELVN